MSTPERDLEIYERDNERADELENYQDFISDLEDLTDALSRLSLSAPTSLFKHSIEKMLDRAQGVLDAAREHIE